MNSTETLQFHDRSGSADVAAVSDLGKSTFEGAWEKMSDSVRAAIEGALCNPISSNRERGQRAA